MLPEILLGLLGSCSDVVSIRLNSDGSIHSFCVADDIDFLTVGERSQLNLALDQAWNVLQLDELQKALGKQQNAITRAISVGVQQCLDLYRLLLLDCQEPDTPELIDDPSGAEQLQRLFQVMDSIRMWFPLIHSFILRTILPLCLSSTTVRDVYTALQISFSDSNPSHQTLTVVPCVVAPQLLHDISDRVDSAFRGFNLSDSPLSSCLSALFKQRSLWETVQPLNSLIERSAPFIPPPPPTLISRAVFQADESFAFNVELGSLSRRLLWISSHLVDNHSHSTEHCPSTAARSIQSTSFIITTLSSTSIHPDGSHLHTWTL